MVGRLAQTDWLPRRYFLLVTDERIGVCGPRKLVVPRVARPRLRGVSHQYAFVAAVAAGVELITKAEGTRASVAAAAFAVSVAAMFGMSALYHRVIWSPSVRLWMRRLDHATLFGAIAGSYTAFGLLGLPSSWRWSVLAVVWAGAATAVVLKFVRVSTPKWVAAAIAICLGWLGIVTLPVLARTVGVTGIMLLASGGLLHTLGGIVYVRRRPDPVPAVFGYHEVFHALVVVAVALQYTVAALFLPWR